MRDRYLDETPAESAERERAENLDAQAEMLAQVMIEQRLDRCDVTDILRSEVIEAFYADSASADAWEQLVFEEAASGTAPTLLKVALLEAAKSVILTELRAMDANAREDAELDRALNRGVA